MQNLPGLGRDCGEYLTPNARKHPNALGLGPASCTQRRPGGRRIQRVPSKTEAHSHMRDVTFLASRAPARHIELSWRFA